MENIGDEGIREKFFSDLKRFFYPTLEADGLVNNFEKVGFISNQTDTSSDDHRGLSSDDDQCIEDMKHPIRPNAEDCWFFIRTGKCYIPRCKFNHPPSANNLVDVKVGEGQSNGNCVTKSSRNLSQIPCKFYPTGLCKYGESCRFNHSNSEAENSPLQLNVLGLPKRLGKEECNFYMRTGMCGYGTSCRFHHPDPIFVFIPQLYVPIVAGESVDNHKEASEITDARFSVYQAPKRNEGVEDPPTRELCVLNDVGLPLRPGNSICWYYKNLGLCKRGRACAYYHPMTQSSKK